MILTSYISFFIHQDTDESFQANESRPYSVSKVFKQKKKKRIKVSNWIAELLFFVHFFNEFNE